MQTSNITLIAYQFLKKTFSNKGLFVLFLIFTLVLILITTNSWGTYNKHKHTIQYHQEMSRKSWEDNPDKHPHRMAHFGNFAFRQQHPLTIFDSGIETYTGNSIFLEAHKQNTANFSQASLSTGLVRFGNLDIAMLLQLILPLIICFVGHSCVSAEKENGILKLIYMQGASIKEILLGKFLGLFVFSALFFVPAFICLWSLSLIKSAVVNSDILTRVVFITFIYFIFYLILCGIIVIISAKSKNSSSALLRLLGGWLFFFIIMPKTAQVIGNSIYPNLSKIEFNAKVEDIISKKGDSHNPNDAHFKLLRDSILKANHVTNVKDLPFNYSGYLMSRGEKQSADVYKDQHKKLITTYRKQNSITNKLIWVNPYLALKKLSMSLSGTDFNTYVNFLNLTESYRYKQSQYMNKLQMQFISNKAKSSEGKVHVVGKHYWKTAPKFKYKFIEVFTTINTQLFSLIALAFWLLLPVLIIMFFSNKFKII